MESIFRFWGYSRSVAEELSGRSRLLEKHTTAPLETKFGQIIFSEKILKLLGNYREFCQGLTGYVKVSRLSAPLEGTPVVELKETGNKEPRALVMMDASERFHFYFNLDQTIQFIQQEQYRRHEAPIYIKLGLGRQPIPIWLRHRILLLFNLLRKILLSVHAPVAFPKLWKDFSVDVWRFLIRAIVDNYSGQSAPMPLWPEGKNYAITLNHDVDTTWAFENPRGIQSFREIEEDKGFRSAWLIVMNLGHRWKAELHDLMRAGHEIGFHSYDHSHQLAYESKKHMQDDISLAESLLREFDCIGFRSPSFHHSPQLYNVLDSFMRYDMTMHDVFENINSPIPSYEGCSTCFPFLIKGTSLLEIPTTIAEDVVLEMRHMTPPQALDLQIQLIEQVAKRQGVANILTHPEPYLSARPEWFPIYESLLTTIAKDSSAWMALPRDIWQWWQGRSERINALWQS